jgi:hypothetical protein
VCGEHAIDVGETLSSHALCLHYECEINLCSKSEKRQNSVAGRYCAQSSKYNKIQIKIIERMTERKKEKERLMKYC